MHHGNAEENAVRVELGFVVVTLQAMDVLEEARIEAEDLLHRHQEGDWGDVPGEDAEMNEANLEGGLLVISSYPVGEAKVWVMTDLLEGTTTILLPEEY